MDIVTSSIVASVGAINCDQQSTFGVYVHYYHVLFLSN